ncbi:MAG: TonB-dependent receptor [Pseudomonadales bacterium]
MVKFRHTLLLSAFTPLLFWAPASAAEEAQANGEIEEIVVTGSYLKRTTADSPSPLSVVTKADLDELGAVDVKDVVNTLTFNSGNISQSSAFYGGDDSTGDTSINLRNLGVGSTLVLINGKRAVATSTDQSGNGYVDLQGWMPNIALERVEIVKDGASALYGSDAIAGVVNFITRTEFEGFELQYDYQTDDETRKATDQMVSAIFGVGNDRGNVVISGSWLNRAGLQIADRYGDFGRTGVSTFGQPGRYVALGAITPDTGSYFVPGGSTSFGAAADPDCDIAAVDDGPQGVQGTLNGLCIYDFSQFFNLAGEEEVLKVHSTAKYAVTDTFEVYGEASFSDNTFFRGNSLYPDVTFAIVPATSPGLQLDAERRGIEPVPYLALQRLLGGTTKSPFADRPVNTDTRVDRQFFRAGVGFTWDLDLGGRSWSLDASVFRSEQNLSASTGSDTVTRNTDLAYNGLGGPQCDPNTGTPGSGNLGTGSCYYYNPFGSSRYDPVTGERWNTADTSPWAANPSLTVAEAARLYQNPIDLYQWMAGQLQQQGETRQTVADAVFAGDLWDTDYGAVGLAIGAQVRREEATVDYDKNYNDNNYKFVYGAQDWRAKLNSYALFTELFYPINDWAELSLAARYENYDEINADTLDPKATLLLRPSDDLSVRLSWGTSFRVGSLQQLFGSVTSLINSSDPYSGTGGLAFRPSISTGNEDLKPEDATVFNVGFSWAPTDGALEGLSVDLDYFNYEYKDIITREQHQALINADNLSRCPNGLNSDPNAGPLCGAIDTNSDGLPELYSIGPGLPDKVIRNEIGGLLRTEASYVNAQSLDTDGVDTKVGYRWEMGNLGLFRAEVNASWTRTYDLVTPDGTKIDGVGSRNASNSVGRAMPEWKWNASLGWTRDRHSALVTVRYIDSYKDDVPQDPVRGAYFGFHPDIDSMTTVDVQYSLQLPAFSFQEEGSSITIGMKNALNETPPKVNVDGGYDPFTHNPMGRIFYGRYTLSM